MQRRFVTMFYFLVAAGEYSRSFGGRPNLIVSLFINGLNTYMAVRFTLFWSMAIYVLISQGSVEKRSRKDGICNYGFTANSLLSLSVKAF